MSAEPRESWPILFLGCVSFRSLRQRPQQLALALALALRGRARVLYADPPRSRLGRLSAPESHFEDLPAHAESFELLVPPPALPFSGYLPLLNRLNCSSAASLFRHHLAARGASAPRAIVAGFPKHFDLLRSFPGVPVLYDVMDDYPLFHDRWQGAVLARLHLRLLRRADVVFATSPKLEERCRPFARRVERLPNAVDAAFHEACGNVAPDPAVLRLPAPRIGYVGALARRWIDFDAIASLAAACPGGSVVLVGPSVGEAPTLPPNVQRLGVRPHARLPAVLRALHVGIVPFRRTPLTDAVNAVKIYEYLSAGLPVLSTDTDGSRVFGDLVDLCRTAGDWGAAVARALSKSSAVERARRRAFAADNLWTHRADALLRALEAVEATLG